MKGGTRRLDTGWAGVWMRWRVDVWLWKHCGQLANTFGCLSINSGMEEASLCYTKHMYRVPYVATENGSNSAPSCEAKLEYFVCLLCWAVLLDD